MIKYNVNKEKRVITAILTEEDDFFEIKRFIGIARCAPDDEWNEELGKELAKKRALLKACNTEINAIGQRIKHYQSCIDKLRDAQYKQLIRLSKLQQQILELSWK